MKRRILKMKCLKRCDMEMVVCVDEVATSKPEITVRKEFPETWIWDNFNVYGLVHVQSLKVFFFVLTNHRIQ